MHQGGAVERAIGGFREHASAGFDDGEIGNHDSFARRQGGLDKPNRCIAPAQDAGKSYWLFVIGYWEKIRRSRFFKERGHLARIFNPR
jgi:hypothetical protein